MSENNTNQEVEVNGKKITFEEFQQITEDPNKRLKEIEKNKYKTLEKLNG